MKSNSFSFCNIKQDSENKILINVYNFHKDSQYTKRDFALFLINCLTMPMGEEGPQVRVNRGGRQVQTFAEENIMSPSSRFKMVFACNHFNQPKMY